MTDDIETETVTVEVELEVRLPTDDGFSFDPLANQISNGTIDGIDTRTKATRIRDENGGDLLTEFGDSTFDTTGVFLPMNEVVIASYQALKESSQPVPETE